MIGFVVFAILAAISVAQMVVTDWIRVRLSARHGTVFQELQAASWPNRLLPMGDAVAKFVRKRRDKGLGDPALSRMTVISVGLQYAALVAFVAFMAVVFSMMHR